MRGAQPVTADMPCCTPGCTQTRYVTSGGKVMPNCRAHHTEYFRLKNIERRKRRRDGVAAQVGHPGKRKAAGPAPVLAPPVAAKPKRLPGKPRPATVIINEQLGTVRQVRGNDVIREYPLPARGLHEQTLELLKERGWKIRYERKSA